MEFNPPNVYRLSCAARARVSKPERHGGCRREVACNACRIATAVTPSRSRKSSRLGRRTEAGPRQLLAVVSCDVPGRCSLKRVAHPGDFRQSESSSNKQVDRKGPDERPQECAKLSRQSSAADQTSLQTRMVGARGVGG